MTILGMSPDEVEQAASTLEQGAEELDRSASSLSAQLGAFAWFGQVAIAFVDRWSTRHRPAMTASARALREAAEQLRAEARAQREASSESVGLGARPVPRVDAVKVSNAEAVIRQALDTGGWGVTAGDLDKIRKAFEGLTPEERAAVMAGLTSAEIAVLRDQMQESTTKGGWTHAQQASFLRLFESEPEALRRLLGDDFPTPAGPEVAVNGFNTGMDAVADVMGRAGSGEIVIRTYPDGRVLVYMPGIEDFQWNPFEMVGRNEADTPRDMRWAAESATAGGNPSETWENPYAASVRLALQSAGIPPGAHLVLAGHSFGAYTAMELGCDPTFNGGGAYHVDGVVAMAADVDWRMDDVAERGTPGILLNDRQDPAAKAESFLVRNPHEGAPGWIRRQFEAPTGWEKGHDGGAYGGELRTMDTPSYLQGLDQPSQEVRYRVHDLYR